MRPCRHRGAISWPPSGARTGCHIDEVVLCQGRNSQLPNHCGLMAGGIHVSVGNGLVANRLGSTSPAVRNRSTHFGRVLRRSAPAPGGWPRARGLTTISTSLPSGTRSPHEPIGPKPGEPATDQGGHLRSPRAASQRTESSEHSPERTSGRTNMSSCPPIAVGLSPDNWLKSCTMCIWS